MLAYNGLALITEKLQNQRLEEAASSSTTTSCCGKLPQVTQENTLKSDRPLQHKLSVKGKNVWTLSVESSSERSGHHHSHHHQHHSHQHQHQHHHEFIQPSARNPCTSLRPPEKDPSSSICRHRKLRYLCQICDTSPGTPSAPPKKKHCRSLSVPPDGPTSTALPSPTPRRDSGGGGPKLLKPIAVLPLANNNNGQQEKDRNTAAAFVSLTSPGTGSSSSSSSTSSSMWLPKLNAGSGSVNKLVPSPPSVDSGHFTTSDLQTPPGSPVPSGPYPFPPRPASAASDTTSSSFSSLLGCSAWQDYNAIPGGVRFGRARVLENRSLSFEDRISGISGGASSSSPSAATTTSMPCVHHGGVDGMSSSRCRSSSGHGDDSSGVSNVAGCSGGVTIPRCHSQPCVLHHRRCGQKRRRDCDRPTLNFNKMTETAYVRPYRRSDPWNTPASDRQAHGNQLQYNFLDSASRNPFTLNPIASSPLDSEQLPVAMMKSYNLQDKYEGELSRAASLALPLTPPDFGGNSPGSLLRHVDSNKEKVHEEDEEEEDDDEEEEEDSEEHRYCSCHGNNRQESSVDLFPMNDLDLELIENS